MSRKQVFVFAAALSAFATGASAQDYVLTVPVNISGMPPEIREIEITCSVSALRAGSTTAYEDIGSAAPVRRPVTGGAFSGDVTININRSPFAGGRMATRYSCHTRAYGTVGGRPAEFWSYDDPTTGSYGLRMPPGSAIRLEIPARPGAPKVVSITGTIP
jgi:hypothetical protein